MFWKWCLRLFVILLGLWLLLGLLSRLGAEIFWFQEVGYLQVFLLRLVTKAALVLFVTAISAVYLWGNLSLAQQLKYPSSLKIAQVKREEAGLSAELRNLLSPQYTKYDNSQINYTGLLPIKLRWLLPIVLILSLLVGLMLAHYGQI